jgi:hypothetical protein
MARLPSYITPYAGKRVVTYEARINYVTSDGRRLQPKRWFKTLDAAKEWPSARPRSSSSIMTVCLIVLMS